MRISSNVRVKRVGGTASSPPQQHNAIIGEESTRSYGNNVNGSVAPEKREEEEDDGGDQPGGARFVRALSRASLSATQCIAADQFLYVYDGRFMSITGAESASALQFLEVRKLAQFALLAPYVSLLSLCV